MAGVATLQAPLQALLLWKNIEIVQGESLVRSSRRREVDEATVSTSANEGGK